MRIFLRIFDLRIFVNWITSVYLILSIMINVLVIFLKCKSYEFAKMLEIHCQYFFNKYLTTQNVLNSWIFYILKQLFFYSINGFIFSISHLTNILFNQRIDSNNGSEIRWSSNTIYSISKYPKIRCVNIFRSTDVR